MRIRVEGGVATVVLERPTVDARFVRELRDAVRAWNDDATVSGVILTSEGRHFCLGADLDALLADPDASSVLSLATGYQDALAELEDGKPVVAVLNGSALGGGFELALACRGRVGVAATRTRVGLPEVTLGVIPGAGGTWRLPRLVGLEKAYGAILTGTVFDHERALEAGLLDRVEPTVERGLAAARGLLAELAAEREMPAPRPGSDVAMRLTLGAAAKLYAATAGSEPAATRALAVIDTGSRMTRRPALALEARAFAALVPAAHDRIRTLFRFKREADKLEGLPQADAHGFRKVAILGAGMMGTGLARVCARAGLSVVLRDVGPEALSRARENLSDVRVTVTDELDAVRGADLVIEAVFEDLALKHRVIRETEPLLGEGAVFATNTSALPIAELVRASAQPARFLGLHFFSPVEKMPLLEVIPGTGTSEATLARCLRLGRALRKTPVVVGDGYGFYTSRVFASYIREGAQLVCEGFPPQAVEWAAREAGMAVPPLQVLDEVSLTLGAHALEGERRSRKREAIAGDGLIERMVAAGRSGRAGGAGFYEYAGRRRRGIWPGLAGLVDAAPRAAPTRELGERLLLAQVAEVGRALDDGVILRARDAELGAVLGIGFPPGLGGPLSFVDRYGAGKLVAALDERAEAHGPRYAPAERLRAMAATGERFFAG